MTSSPRVPYSLVLDVRAQTPIIPTCSFTYHKTRSQTNRHPSVNCHSRRGQPLPPSILLLITFALTPSPIPSLSSIGGVTRRFHIPIHEEKAYRLTLKARRIHRPKKPPRTTDPSDCPPQHLCLQFLPCHESPGLLGGPAHLYQ